jgi:hypothetical protein
MYGNSGWNCKAFEVTVRIYYQAHSKPRVKIFFFEVLPHLICNIIMSKDTTIKINKLPKKAFSGNLHKLKLQSVSGTEMSKKSRIIIR